MLPLVKKMQVVLQDHLDRNPDKQQLRGRVGYVESWVLHSDEDSKYEDGRRILRRPPKVVFVRFQEYVENVAGGQWQDCKWVIGDRCA